MAIPPVITVVIDHPYAAFVIRVDKQATTYTQWTKAMTRSEFSAGVYGLIHVMLGIFRSNERWDSAKEKRSPRGPIYNNSEPDRSEAYRALAEVRAKHEGEKPEGLAQP